MTKVFTPSITPADLAEALKTPEDFVLSEKARAELTSGRNKYIGKQAGYSLGILAFGALLLIAGSIFSFPGTIIFRLGGLVVMALSPIFFFGQFLTHLLPPNQLTPEGCLAEYLSNLLSYFPDYEKSYRVLAPATMDGLTLDNFTRRWKAADAGLKSVVASPNRAQCSVCGKVAGGLWSFPHGAYTGEYVLSEDYLKKSADFLHCSLGNCPAVYCSNCFVKLVDGRRCRACGRALQGMALRIFMVGAKIQLEENPSARRCTKATSDAGRIERLCCELNFSPKCMMPWDDRYVFHPITSKGALVCRLHNSAIKIGAKWYLMAGDPGTMTDAECPPATPAK
ncbi:MAG: hypothetical protein PSU94_17275 [Lacunisphaera sp.]|nr:hypothetical protein [Lacunisphaera sp.]